MGLAVAGFHRSGTSSIAQHLMKSGLNLGSDLIGANEYNPFGYFEDWGPVRFHDGVLSAAGLDWASVTRDEIPMNEEQKSYIRTYCGERATHTLDWGFKDPRICQFLERWMEVDSSLKALIIYRSPTECCWSIYRRAVRDSVRADHADEISDRIIAQSDHALALWVTHNQKLLEVLRRFPDRTITVSHAGFAAGFNVAAALREHFGLGLDPADVSQTYRADVVTRQVATLPISNSQLRDEAIEIWNALQRFDLAACDRHESDELPFCDDPTGVELANHLLSMEASETRKFADERVDAVCNQVDQLVSDLDAMQVRLTSAQEEAEFAKAEVFKAREDAEVSKAELLTARKDAECAKAELLEVRKDAESAKAELLEVRKDAESVKAEFLAAIKEIDLLREKMISAKKLARKSMQFPFSLFFRFRKKYRNIIDYIIS